MKKEITDILIIGAGPSGMVAASYLHKMGIKCRVVEKSRFPRFSIGESLIPRCMDNFEEAGLLDVLKESGFQKKTGARFIKGSEVGEFDFSKKFGSGWDWTWQVPRADFDLVLAKEVQRKGVQISFETEVTRVVFNGKKSLTSIKYKSGETTAIEADFVIDSSGYGRVLARQLKLEASPKIAAHSSIFTHIRETRRPTGKEGNLITFEVLDTQTWFWYIPFSNGISSLGFVAPNNWFKNFSAINKEAFGEMLQLLRFYNKRFEKYPFLFEPQNIRNMAKNVTKLHGAGFAITGNSGEFLDPVFSSGVSFATESGLLAAKLAKKEIYGEHVDWQKDYTDYLQKGVEVFSSYVKEWYSGNLQQIIFHRDPNPLIKEQICAVLAGYVWDDKNPFVVKHNRILKNVSKLIEMENLEV